MKLVLALLFLVSALGCTKTQPAAEPSSPVSAESLVARGKVVYQTTCIACHNADPSKDGGVGPAVAGSSKELLEARVLTSNYPAGYKPKRETHVMPQFPHLKNDIDALAAYLK